MQQEQKESVGPEDFLKWWCNPLDAAVMHVAYHGLGADPEVGTYVYTLVTHITWQERVAQSFQNSQREILSRF